MAEFVVGMGEVLWDMLPDGKKIGGAPANFAYHVSQFGLPGCAVSAVGNDELGTEILTELTAKEINNVIAVVPFPTGTVQVKIDEDGIPNYDIKENVAWDNIPYTPELKRLAQNTRAVCFGSLAQRSPVSRATINSFLDDMPATDDTLIVFDINLRQDFFHPERLQNSMHRCNILKINDEELMILGKMFEFIETSAEELCRRILIEYNLKILILTCGINGSYVFTKDNMYFQPTPEVEVADTVGAGDSFTAAFIASLLRGKTIPQAHSAAVRTSAYICSQNGAMPVLPDYILNE
ncbi:MAG: carbohydrate kinase [Paramuribaculum sp.]|nr:carbohydrate kinase [Paramuribaculum sp.]